jgi:hypothetical protein
MMNKARAYVKSVQSRGALACAFLLREWQKLLCHWNYHDDELGVWFDLTVALSEKTHVKIGDRVVFTCSRCGSHIQGDHFATPSDRQRWASHPGRRATLRDWSSQ